MNWILTFMAGMVAGAVVVPLWPGLFRLAARIRGWLQDNFRIGP